MGQNFAYTVSSSNELDKKINVIEGDSNDVSAVRYLQPVSSPPSSADSESTFFQDSVSSQEDLTATAASTAARKEAAILKRKKKKKSPSATSLACNTFHELYTLGEVLGEGAYARVQTCTNLFTGTEYAAKIIDKVPSHSRRRVLREIDLFHRCEGHKNIIKMIEYYEEQDKFYLVFEKVSGGQLFNHLQKRKIFTEKQAAEVTSDVASALQYLHAKGIAHRDLKPENILCVYEDRVTPVKLCDFDLGSAPEFKFTSKGTSDNSPKLLTPVGTFEFMAPEVVEAFFEDSKEELAYDKRCDLWSLGVMIYILLCGYPPFSGCCGDDCGWKEGGGCHECQMRLFDSIMDGHFHFPSRDWDHISEEAKGLITSLLVKDAKKRMSASEMMQHPWLQNNRVTELQTPGRLRSYKPRSVSMFAEAAVCTKRVILQHEAAEAGKAEVGEDTLSPPSQSSLMKRRHAQLNTKGVSRRGSCGTLIEKSKLRQIEESPVSPVKSH